jgi:hypothetical protein
MLVRLRRPLHEPISVDAKRMESMEAAIDANQINPVSEGCSFHLSFVVAERLQADRAAANQRVVVGCQAISQVLIHLEH